MNLPIAISKLIQAQNEYDSAAYAACFVNNATVFDEGETYKGREAIRTWIEKANDKYHTVLKPLDISKNNEELVLRAAVSGTFAGSPAILNYHFLLADALIESLTVTG